jgi:hypothetical protein
MSCDRCLALSPEQSASPPQRRRRSAAVSVFRRPKSKAKKSECLRRPAQTVRAAVALAPADF